MNSISFFKALLIKEIDEELKGGQKKLDVAKPKGKITKADFAALRSKKEIKEIKVDYDFSEDELEKIIQTLKRHYSTLVSPIKAMETALGKQIPAFNDMMNEMDDDQIRPDLKSVYDQGYKAGYAKCKFDMTGEFPDLSENQDHEVSMAHNSLKSIVSSASQLMNLLGQDEKDIPAWIQDHITNAENYINQASKNYHDYSGGEDEEEVVGDMTLQSMMEDLLEAKKKPSAGLTKKQKSNIVKKAKAGKDMGKKGKGFEKIVKAAKKSGADNPEAVAGAAFWKGQAKKAK